MNLNDKFHLSKYVRTIKRPDGIAIYHSLFGGLSLINQTVWQRLNFFKKPKTALEFLKFNKYPKDKLESLLTAFEQRGWVVKAGQNEYRQIEKFARDRMNKAKTGREIGVAQLVMTNNCNFNCKYCFVNSIYSSKQRTIHQPSLANKIMAKADAVKYLKQVIALVKKHGRKYLSVQFFGGEPLVNWETIKYVFDYFSDGKKFGIKISYSMVTNGSLITDEIAEYFKKYQAPAIVSFDSPRQNDRPLKSGGSSLELIKRGLKILKKHNNIIIFNSALTEETWSYFDTDLVDYALKAGCHEIGVLLDLDLKFYQKHSTKAIVDKLWRVYEYGQKQGVIVTGYWHQVFQLLAQFKKFNTRRFKTCSAMGAQLSIEPDGSIFACKGSSAYFGNIKKLNQLLKSPNYQNYSRRAYFPVKTCHGCDIENFCSGFCPGPLEKKYGNIFRIEPIMCEIYQKLIKKLIINMDGTLIPKFFCD